MWKKKNEKVTTIEEVIINNLNLKNINEIKKWFNKDFYIKNIDKIANYLLSNKEKNITIVGDYDCDGITSTTILYRTLKELGFNVSYRIPKRKTEGYGLNPIIIDEIESGILITLDNGIAAFPAIDKAKEKGLTVIIIDHHLPVMENDKIVLPNADIIVDPHIEEKSIFKNYCAAGLAYKLVLLLTDDINLLNTANSLACIGTIADLMPLVEENYVIVKKGLKTLTLKDNTGRNIGLFSLLRKTGLDDLITETDISFKLAPCINSAGRLYDDGASYVMKLLTCEEDIEKADKMSDALLLINDERKKKKENGTEKVKENIIKNHLENDFPLIVYEPNIEEGVIGNIAGNIKELYKRPCIILSDTTDSNIVKGSGRTYGDINLYELLSPYSDDYYSFGGHSGACGISIKKENLQNCLSKMQNNTSINLTVDEDNYYDLEIDTEKDDIVQICKDLLKYTPFGEGNKKIVFKINYKCFAKNGKDYSSIMGSKKQAIKLYGKGYSAVSFDGAEKYLALGSPKNLVLYGTITINHFNGNIFPQIEIIDFYKANKNTDKILTELQKKLYSIK